MDGADSAVERSGSAKRVSRWPAAVALLAIGGLYLLVSERLTLGPPWLLLLAIVALLIPLGLARRIRQLELARWTALTAAVAVTIAVVASTFYLVGALPARELPGPTLLQGAAVIWVTNVLTFALWYWEIDGGGPADRSGRPYGATDFLFPQLTLDANPFMRGWSPTFLDYLFLAFSMSAAFSPTDTMILSRRAKVLVMIQAAISLLVIAVLAARAINTLR